MTCPEARVAISLRLDGELDAISARELDMHLGSCAECTAVQRAFELEQTALPADAVRAPDGFAERLGGMLPARRAPRRARRWLAAAAVLVMVLLGAGLVWQPTALAQLGLFLRQVVLRETPLPPDVRPVAVGPLTLDEAQQRVPWRIREPSGLPDGYRLVAVEAGAIHASASGPSVILHYQSASGAAGELSILELQAASPVDEPVEPGAARPILVGTHTALFIDGQWVNDAWQPGTLARLILEQGDLVIQLQGDPRQGWNADRLADIAASLR